MLYIHIIFCCALFFFLSFLLFCSSCCGGVFRIEFSHISNHKLNWIYKKINNNIIWCIGAANEQHITLLSTHENAQQHERGASSHTISRPSEQHVFNMVCMTNLQHQYTVSNRTEIYMCLAHSIYIACVWYCLAKTDTSRY